eukprot:g2421.t1
MEPFPSPNIAMKDFSSSPTIDIENRPSQSEIASFERNQILCVIKKAFYVVISVSILASFIVGLYFFEHNNNLTAPSDHYIILSDVLELDIGVLGDINQLDFNAEGSFYSLHPTGVEAKWLTKEDVGSDIFLQKQKTEDFTPARRVSFRTNDGLVVDIFDFPYSKNKNPMAYLIDESVCNVDENDSSSKVKKIDLLGKSDIHQRRRSLLNFDQSLCTEERNGSRACLHTYEEIQQIHHDGRHLTNYSPVASARFHQSPYKVLSTSSYVLWDFSTNPDKCPMLTETICIADPDCIWDLANVVCTPKAVTPKVQVKAPGQKYDEFGCLVEDGFTTVAYPLTKKHCFRWRETSNCDYELQQTDGTFSRTKTGYVLRQTGATSFTEGPNQKDLFRGFVNSDGDYIPYRDENCDFTPVSSKSGYCECGSGYKIRTGQCAVADVDVAPEVSSAAQSPKTCKTLCLLQAKFLLQKCKESASDPEACTMTVDMWSSVDDRLTVPMTMDKTLTNDFFELDTVINDQDNLTDVRYTGTVRSNVYYSTRLAYRRQTSYLFGQEDMPDWMSPRCIVKRMIQGKLVDDDVTKQRPTAEECITSENGVGEWIEGVEIAAHHTTVSEGGMLGRTKEECGGLNTDLCWLDHSGNGRHARLSIAPNSNYNSASVSKTLQAKDGGHKEVKVLAGDKDVKIEFNESLFPKSMSVVSQNAKLRKCDGLISEPIQAGCVLVPPSNEFNETYETDFEEWYWSQRYAGTTEESSNGASPSNTVKVAPTKEQFARDCLAEVVNHKECGDYFDIIFPEYDKLKDEMDVALTDLYNGILDAPPHRRSSSDAKPEWKPCAEYGGTCECEGTVRFTTPAANAKAIGNDGFNWAKSSAEKYFEETDRIPGVEKWAVVQPETVVEAEVVHYYRLMYTNTISCKEDVLIPDKHMRNRYAEKVLNGNDSFETRKWNCVCRDHSSLQKATIQELETFHKTSIHLSADWSTFKPFSQQSSNFFDTRTLQEMSRSRIAINPLRTFINSTFGKSKNRAMATCRCLVPQTSKTYFLSDVGAPTSDDVQEACTSTAYGSLPAIPTDSAANHAMFDACGEGAVLHVNPSQDWALDNWATVEEEYGTPRLAMRNQVYDFPACKPNCVDQYTLLRSRATCSDRDSVMLDSRNVPSVRLCAALCSAKPGCNYFSFETQGEGNCKHMIMELFTSRDNNHNCSLISAENTFLYSLTPAKPSWDVFRDVLISEKLASCGDKVNHLGGTMDKDSRICTNANPTGIQNTDLNNIMVRWEEANAFDLCHKLNGGSNICSDELEIGGETYYSIAASHYSRDDFPWQNLLESDHLVPGRIYRKDGVCFIAKTNCAQCLNRVTVATSDEFTDNLDMLSKCPESSQKVYAMNRDLTDKTLTFSNCVMLTMLTTAKVIVGLLLMLIVTPFLDPSPVNESRQKSLRQINSFLVNSLQGCVPTVDSTGHALSVPYNGTVETAKLLPEPFAKAAEDFCTTATVANYDAIYQNYVNTYSGVIYFSLSGRIYVRKDDLLETLREIEMQHAWVSDNVWKTAAEARKNEPFMASFNIRDLRQREAEFAMYSTTYLIVLLVFGMIAFNNDAKKISTVITVPLGHIGDEMDAIASMNMDFEATRIVSNVYEIKRMQAAVYKMRRGIDSFTRFIPREVVRKMIRAGQEAELNVSDRVVTTFFSDVAAFTTICEQMEPLPLIEMLTQYFDNVSPLIIKSNGSILDYIGDAVLACWNAPEDVENHGWQAVEHSLQMHEVLDVLRVEWIEKKFPKFYIRCGIHTGLVFVGNVGGTRRMKYSVLGNGVHMAERLEDGNKKYAGRLMITEDTRKEPKVADDFLLKHVDYIDIRDQKEPMAVYNVVCRKKDASPEAIAYVERHCLGMKLYTERKFSEAAEIFEKQLSEEYRWIEPFMNIQYSGKDKAAEMLLKRCQKLAAKPPGKEWDMGKESPI